MKEFYALEGLDATGKSTIIGKLRGLGYPVYKTPPEEMSRYRDFFEGKDLPSRFTYYLTGCLCVGREISWTGGISDRYVLSTVSAHEAMGMSPELLEAMMPIIAGMPKPRKTILLTAIEDVRLQRLNLRGANRKDVANMKINTKLLKGFRRWSNRLEMEMVEVDTSTLSPDQVLEEVLNEIRR